MQKLFAILSLVVFCSSSAMAASRTSSQASVQKLGASNYINVGPQLTTINGEAGFGIGADLLFDVTSKKEIFVGVHTGFNKIGIDTGSFTNVDASLTAIPLLVTGIYRFRLPSSQIRPFAGLSTGIIFGSGSIEGTIGDQTFEQSFSENYFNIMLRSGIELPIQTGALVFEPRIGLADGDFVFQPTAAYQIAI